MILAFLFLAGGIGAPTDLIDSAALLSENAVLGGSHARLSIACAGEKAVMRLRWPEDLQSAVVLVGVGRASGQDAVMQPDIPWKVIERSARETLAESADVAVLADFQPGEEFLLLEVETTSTASTAEFSIAGVQAAHAKVADRCH